MVRIKFVVFLMLAVSAVLSSQAASPDNVQDDISGVVARNIAARGGAEAWRAVQSISMNGRMEAGKNSELRFHLEMKRPRKMRLELAFQQKTAIQVYDGQKGWKTRPYLNRNDVEPLTAEELQAASEQADLDGVLFNYAEKGFRLQSAGTEALDGTDTVKLKLLKNGQVVYQVWLDSKTGLEKKVSTTRRIRGTEKQIDTYYGQYKRVGSVLIPHELATSVSGMKGTHKMMIDTVLINPKLQDAIFSKP
jgi:outer membrane lipoprotein-sorting protein